MSSESKNGIQMRQLLDMVSELTIKVKHLPGSSKYKPLNSISWKEFWENKSSERFPCETEKCACCKEDTEPDDFVGAHIIDVKTEQIYIYPLCSSCNSKYGINKQPSPEFFAIKSKCVDFSPEEAKIVHPEE